MACAAGGRTLFGSRCLPQGLIWRRHWQITPPVGVSLVRPVARCLLSGVGVERGIVAGDVVVKTSCWVLKEQPWPPVVGFLLTGGASLWRGCCFWPVPSSTKLSVLPCGVGG